MGAIKKKHSFQFQGSFKKESHEADSVKDKQVFFREKSKKDILAGRPEFQEAQEKSGFIPGP